MRSLFVLVLFAVPAWAADPVADSKTAVEALKKELAAGTAPKDLAEKPFAAVPLTKSDSTTARELLWKAHVERITKDRAAEIKDRLLKLDKLEMPFFIKEYGAKPKVGHSLWISLHGGGGAPKQVNDGQYENQKLLYKLEEGLYLAPRAPTNTWNLWHEGHIDTLFAQLIEDLIVLEGIDPDRVYVLGYSAGGDGVYQIAPRMADRLAAAAMMAGHPNDASPLGLRNVPFALQVGGNDSAYNRNKIAKEWGDKLDALQKDDPKGYEHFVKIHEGKGHWMNLEDKAALPWMAKFTRNPTPEKIVWKQSSRTHDASYWLGVPPGTAKGGTLITAVRKGQSVDLTTVEGVEKIFVRFDDRMVDLEQPVTVTHKGKKVVDGHAVRTIGTLAKTLTEKGDSKLMFDAEVVVTIGK